MQQRESVPTVSASLCCAIYFLVITHALQIFLICTCCCERLWSISYLNTLWYVVGRMVYKGCSLLSSTARMITRQSCVLMTFCLLCLLFHLLKGLHQHGRLTLPKFYWSHLEGEFLRFFLQSLFAAQCWRLQMYAHGQIGLDQRYQTMA